MPLYYGVICPNKDKIAIGLVAFGRSNEMHVLPVPELNKPIMCPACGDSSEYEPDKIKQFDDPDCYLPNCPH